MKTTVVSIPDDVFERAEVLARRGHQSRSEAFSRALREYAARHLPGPGPDDVTEAMDRVCAEVAEVGVQCDPFVTAAARQTLARTEL